MSKLTTTPSAPTLQERLQKALQEGKSPPAFAGKTASAQTPGVAQTPQHRAACANTRCLLLDCSASMAEEVEPGRSKHDALRSLLTQFPLTRKWAFASNCNKVGVLPGPAGSTNMARAFETIKSAGQLYAILITDGAPDDEYMALHSAKGLQLDIFYVGPGPRPAFLDELARRTGGSANSASLKDTKQVGAKIRGLIGS